jgi:hypothetical protein
MWLRDTISERKKALAAWLRDPLQDIARRCLAAWTDESALDRALAEAMARLPSCSLLYVLDRRGVQLSANVGPAGVDASFRGQDLSPRPYLRDNLPYRGFVLSQVYTSRINGDACITAVQALAQDDLLLGFLAVDFPLSHLPATAEAARPPTSWSQYRGDPAIRGQLFVQSRVESRFDLRAQQAMDVLLDLICQHGIFHVKIHFSSSRITLWLKDDPFHYRIHDSDELIDAEMCLAYPLRPYPGEAVVTGEQAGKVLDRFRWLRQADENIYLRSASINVINNMVGLTFSCDGSHYMPVGEFLQRDDSFWFGASSARAAGG